MRARRDQAGGFSRRAIVLVATISVVVLGAISCASAVPRHEGPVSDHFDGRRFYDEPAVQKGLTDVLKWQFSRRSQGPWRRDLTPIDRPAPPSRAADGSLRVTFVNHATVLVQVAGMNLLTDPIWSERASPFAAAGPRRYRPPGLRFRDLPPVDLVLLSHNHFDHMDETTLRMLADDHDPLFLAPLGNCFYLESFGARHCKELDWWQDTNVGTAVTVHAVPVRHWSRRGLLDTNRALWAGYVVETGERRIFFAGDTGMGEHFGEIRRRLGSPDLAMLPIGAYLPRWFMGAQHIDPAQAVEAHEILGARQTMAIHFGTFRLADDGQDQPARELQNALAEAGIPRDEFWIPTNGDSRRWPGGGS